MVTRDESGHVYVCRYDARLRRGGTLAGRPESRSDEDFLGILDYVVKSDPGATSIDELLERARASLTRVTPREAMEAAEGGDLLIDIRPLEQRERTGSIPGAHVVARNVLEWRLDPRSTHRNPELARVDCRLILICNEGYQSSLAAATLRSFGLDATDVIGGAQAWLRADLPIEDGPRN